MDIFYVPQFEMSHVLRSMLDFLVTGPHRFCAWIYERVGMHLSMLFRCMAFWAGHGFFFGPWISARISLMNFSMDFFSAQTLQKYTRKPPEKNHGNIHGKIHGRIPGKIPAWNSSPKSGAESLQRSRPANPKCKPRALGNARRDHSQQRPRHQANFAFLT